jgi:hypothetical protein
VLDDPQRTRDVKARVQNLVDAGEVDFQVARLAEGDDPAYRVVKTVIIDYTIGGRHFRTTGTDPDTVDLGGAEGPEPPASIRRAADGSLLLEARAPGSYDVQTSLYPQCKISVADIPEPLELTGPWDLRFPPNGGAPDRIKLDKLISWADSPDPGVKYYSGAATYTTLFEVPRSMPGKDRRLYLDLGRVKVMARVKLNGKDLGVLWKPPYRMDVTGEVKPGRNSLSVEVVNLWINRMIGDEQLPEDSDRNGNGTLKSWPAWLQANKPSPTGRFTFTTWRLWHKNDPLQESGLVGPVSLRATKLVPVEMTMN